MADSNSVGAKTAAAVEGKDSEWTEDKLKELRKQLLAMPKVELHRHLEGAIRLSTLKVNIPLYFSLGRGISPFSFLLWLMLSFLVPAPPCTRSQELYVKHVHSKKVSEGKEQQSDLTDAELTKLTLAHFCLTVESYKTNSLTQVMERFMHTQAVLDSDAIVERVAYECVEDCALDGINVLEIRYSPQYIRLGHDDVMTLDSIHQAVLRGVKRAQSKYASICVGLVGILDRHLPLKEVEVGLKFILDNKDTFIGMDLANDEMNFDCMAFAHFFQEAKKSGLRITVHAGKKKRVGIGETKGCEVGVVYRKNVCSILFFSYPFFHLNPGEVPVKEAPQWVKNSVDHLCAERIGHGIHVMKDPKIVAEMAEKKVVFEVCPTSNYLCDAVRNLADHPLRAMIDAGLVCTLNTDDPGLFNIRFCVFGVPLPRFPLPCLALLGLRVFSPCVRACVLAGLRAWFHSVSLFVCLLVFSSRAFGVDRGDREYVSFSFFLLLLLLFTCLSVCPCHCACPLPA